MNKLEEIHFKASQNVRGVDYKTYYESVAKKSAEITNDIAVKFAEDCKSLELLGYHIHNYQELFQDFINNHYGK